MKAVRCRGCGRRLGVGPRTVRAFCDAACAYDSAAVADETRDAVIVEVLSAGALNTPVVARLAGVSRQRIRQIVTERTQR